MKEKSETFERSDKQLRVLLPRRPLLAVAEDEVGVDVVPVKIGHRC